MRQLLIFLVMLSAGIAVASPIRAQPAVELGTQTMKTAGKAIDAFSQHEAAAREELSQAKKNALASVSKNLTDMAALKRSMAQHLRCLGETQGKSDPTSQAKFHQCWNDFSSQNEQLHRSLSELKNNMNLADPVWCSEPEHIDDLKAIDALYWQKVALQEDAVTFYDISQSGLIFRKISIDTEKSGALAKAFEASANELDSAAKALGNALKPTQ
jgi:hypothetical protein